MRNVLVVFGVAVIVRAIYVFAFVVPEHLLLEDQSLYIALAQVVLENGVSAVSSERVPGYPLVLAAIHALFGAGPWGVVAVQVLIDSLTCVLTGMLAQAYLKKGFLPAGLISAFNLNMIILSAMVLTDTLFLFLFSLFLLFLTKYLQRRHAVFLLLGMLMLSAATLVRSVSYYLIPVVFLGLFLWWSFKRESLARIGVLATTSAIIVASMLASMHFRNYVEYRSFAFVSQGGTHLLGWVVPATYQYSGKGSYEAGQAWARENLAKAMLRDGLTQLPVNPFDASQYQAGVAKHALQELGWVSVVKAWGAGATVNLFAPSSVHAPAVRAMDHPSFYGTPGLGVVEKLWNYLQDTRGFAYLSILLSGAVVSFMFVLSSLAGFWNLFRASRPGIGSSDHLSILIFFLLIIGYFLAVTGPVIGVKYRLPIEPLLTLFATQSLLMLQRYHRPSDDEQMNSHSRFPDCP